MGAKEFGRPNPDELLRQITAQEQHEARGRLKIFLGYAPRVGKSLRMFDEGRRRKKRGQDVVIGAVQQRGLDDIAGMIREFEIIPPLRAGDADAIDVDAVLKRAPQVCLVDELARDNPAGSRFAHRWQEVEEIRAHGVNVVGAINLQHICEEQQAVENITGRRSPNCVPASFIQTADEIVIVDVPAEELTQPSGPGNLNPAQLSELRELALLLAAQVVEHQLQRYMDAHGILQSWGTQERILVCITPRSSARAMLESGARAERRFHGQLLAVYVKQGELPRAEEEALQENLDYARKLGAEVHLIDNADAKDPIGAIIRFARDQRITQVFIGHTQQSSWKFWSQNPVDRLVKEAEGMDVRIFPPCERAARLMESALKPEPARKRGKLKIFLGYAAGVGKTYQMLTEAQELKLQGVDVAVGYFEPHGRVETIAQTAGLEFVPRRIFSHRGSTFEDMDTAAVIARKPQVAVVDEFAHTNVPGAERPKRWQDVMAILDAGIDVLTSLNIQHIESLNDQVWHVTGIRVRETVPDWVVQEADEVVMVDVTPRALLHRLERGVVYSQEKARQALENFFTESNLTALRELALRQTAHQLEERREELRLPEPVRPLDSARQESILLWLTPHPSTAMLIRRGRRVADYLNSSCTAVFATREAGMPELSQEERTAIERHLNFCRNLRIQAEIIESKEPAKAVAAWAREHGITQIFVTREAPEALKLVHLTRDMQVTIVAERVRHATGGA